MDYTGAVFNVKHAQQLCVTSEGKNRQYFTLHMEQKEQKIQLPSSIHKFNEIPPDPLKKAQMQRFCHQVVCSRKCTATKKSFNLQQPAELHHIRSTIIKDEQRQAVQL